MVRIVQETAPVNGMSAEFISSRLKEERLRLGLTQPDVADICGASKRSIIEWEKQTPIPSDKLASLHGVGFDTYYILTGQRAGGAVVSPVLTREEAALLDNYRHSPPEGKTAIKATSAAFAQSGKKVSKAKQ